jgi:hypothetical protein
MIDPATEGRDKATHTNNATQTNTERGGLDAMQTRRVAWGGAVGSAMEFYDFAGYGYLASTLAVVFFPDVSWRTDAIADTDGRL